MNVKKIVVGMDFLDISKLILKNESLIKIEEDNALFEAYSSLEIPDITEQEDYINDKLSNKEFALKYAKKIVNGEFPVSKSMQFILTYDLEVGYFNSIWELKEIGIDDLYSNSLLLDYKTALNVDNLIKLK